MNVAEAPSRVHKLVFWFLLATLSMALPEVGTMNDPIPWAHAGGWLLEYPVYGLHILVLAGLMYRWPIAGIVTLLAYGGLFGLYEAYMIKQLWNPNWAPEVTANIGGVRILHTLLLVFWAHPLFAFALPLVLSELLAVAPGRLSARLPILSKTRRRTAWFLVLVAVYFGIMIGSKLPGHRQVVIPCIAVGVIALIAQPWRLVLRGHRFRLEDLLPRGRELAVLAVLLVISYLIFGSLLRPEAFPGAWLPHVLVWGIYAFLIGVIVLVTRQTQPIAVEAKPARSNAEALTLGGMGVAVFLLAVWLHAPYTQPGEAITYLSYLAGSVLTLLFLVGWSLRALIARADRESG